MQEANQKQPGYTDKVYSYLRFTEQQRLLIVTNFDTQNSTSFSLTIPESVLQAFNMSDNFRLNGKFGNDQELEYKNGLKLELAPLAGYVFEF